MVIRNISVAIICVISQLAYTQTQTIQSRKDYALFIASNEYKEWKDLDSPVKVAKSLASDLEEFYGFKVELLENPDHEDVLLKLREYARRDYGSQDQLFIYFSGHGRFDELLNEEFIVASDSRLKDPAGKSYLSLLRVLNAIDQIPSEHIFLVLDVNKIRNRAQPVSMVPPRRSSQTTISGSEFISRQLKFRTRKIFLCACEEGPVSPRGSQFSAGILNAIRSMGGENGVLTLSEIKIHIEQLKEEPIITTFGSDEPGSDFIFEVQ